MMSATRTQRLIALFLLISPWFYIPTIFKEIIFIALAVLLYLSTIPLYKKHKTEFDTEAPTPTQSQTVTSELA